MRKKNQRSPIKARSTRSLWSYSLRACDNLSHQFWMAWNTNGRPDVYTYCRNDAICSRGRCQSTDEPRHSSPRILFRLESWARVSFRSHSAPSSACVRFFPRGPSGYTCKQMHAFSVSVNTQQWLKLVTVSVTKRLSKVQFTIRNRNGSGNQFSHLRSNFSPKQTRYFYFFESQSHSKLIFRIFSLSSVIILTVSMVIHKRKPKSSFSNRIFWAGQQKQKILGENCKNRVKMRKKRTADAMQKKKNHVAQILGEKNRILTLFRITLRLIAIPLIWNSAQYIQTLDSK